MLRDWILEALPNTDWPRFLVVLRYGRFTGIKVRKRMYVPWNDVYAVLKQNTDDPVVDMRSDSEIADEFELDQTVAEIMMPAYVVGFRRFLVETSNEPNNHIGTTPEEIAVLIPAWIRFQDRHPNIVVVSVPMMPNSEGEMLKWHHPDLGKLHDLGQHTYSDWWTPWHLSKLRPEFEDKTQWVTEFNQPSPLSRTQNNLKLLKWMATLPYVSGVSYFCGPTIGGDWSGYNITEYEAKVYGEWFESQKGEVKMTREDAIAAAVNLWGRHGAQFNKDINYCRDWLNSFIAGGDAYWGAPEGGEMPVGDYVIMAFAKKRLWWKVGEWVIHDDALPLV